MYLDPEKHGNQGLDFPFSNIKNGKNKKTFRREKWGIREERREDFHLHSQEGQDFSAVTTVYQLITHKSSESRSVDLTSDGTDNHYLRDVDHGSHCLPRHRTASLTYTSEGEEIRGYM